MIRVIIAIWNKNHMALPELGVCPRGVRSMLINDARSMLINDPGFWRQRAEEARRLAARMTDEMAKQTMLMVAEVCDRFAIGRPCAPSTSLPSDASSRRRRRSDAPTMPFAGLGEFTGAF